MPDLNEIFPVKFRLDQCAVYASQQKWSSYFVLKTLNLSVINFLNKILILYVKLFNIINHKSVINDQRTLSAKKLHANQAKIDAPLLFS